MSTYTVVTLGSGRRVYVRVDDDGSGVLGVSKDRDAIGLESVELSPVDRAIVRVALGAEMTPTEFVVWKEAERSGRVVDGVDGPFPPAPLLSEKEWAFLCQEFAPEQGGRVIIDDEGDPIGSHEASARFHIQSGREVGSPMALIDSILARAFLDELRRGRQVVE